MPGLLRLCRMACLNSVRVMRMEYVSAVGSEQHSAADFLSPLCLTEARTCQTGTVSAASRLNVRMRFVRIVVAKYGLNWVGLLGRMR